MHPMSVDRPPLLNLHNKSCNSPPSFTRPSTPEAEVTPPIFDDSEGGGGGGSRSPSKRIDPDDCLTTYMQQFLVTRDTPENPHTMRSMTNGDSVKQTYVEQFADLIEIRKSHWNLNLKREHSYTKQIQLYKHLKRLVKYKDEMYRDLNLMATESDSLHADYYRLYHLLDVEARDKLDRKLTMADHQYKELHEKYMNSLHSIDELRHEFNANMANLHQLKRANTELLEEQKAKRARLGPMDPILAEHCTFTAICNERSRTDSLVAEIKKKYEPFHCGICTDSIATHLTPCCHHLICLPCIGKISNEQSVLPCPYCRVSMQRDAAIEMKF